MKPSSMIVAGLMPLFLLGCASPSPDVAPPEALLAPCVAPETPPGPWTQGDLAEAYLEALRAWDVCRAEKEALSDWARGLSQGGASSKAE